MKIAILFPGIGYTCDRPLLYYAGKICSQCQYEQTHVSYTNLPKSIPEAFPEAYAQAESCLENIRWNEYNDILFISKSIGQVYPIPGNNMAIFMALLLFMI